MKKLYTFTAGRTALAILAVFAAALLVLSFVSVASAAGLKTARADASEIDGTFTLMTYGCSSGKDVANIAILKKEAAGDDINVVGPSAAGEAKSGLGGPEALAAAEKFLACNADVDHTELRKIMSPSGEILGFEVRPQYELGKYGTPDLFSVRYTMEGNAVKAQIMEDPDVDRLIESGD